MNKTVEELLQKLSNQNRELTQLKKQAWNEKRPFGWISAALQINNMVIANVRFSAPETVDQKQLSYIIDILNLNEQWIKAVQAPDDGEELGKR